MSKSRGPTKAQQILAEARQRVDKAMSGLKGAEYALSVAHAQYEAHQDAYDALERTLSQPRKKREKKPKPEQKPLPTSQNGKKAVTEQQEPAILGAL